jgi:hypothetical protein
MFLNSLIESLNFCPLGLFIAFVLPCFPSRRQRSRSGIPPYELFLPILSLFTTSISRHVPSHYVRLAW